MANALRPEEELVLLIAGTRARRQAAATRIGRLLKRLDWDRLVSELERQRLVPLLGERILEHADGQGPQWFAPVVRVETEASRAAATVLELTTLQVCAALESAGVANVAVKGPMLARSLHGDPAMRMSHDIDILVGRADLDAAVKRLETLGWGQTRFHSRLHATVARDDGPAPVEVHWRLHWYETEFGAQALTRAEQTSDGIRRLQPGDELVALLLFHARDGFAGLRHPIDVAAWWDRHGADGSSLLEPVVQRHPALAAAIRASAAVLDRVVGVPAPSLVAAPRRLSWPARRAVAMANPLMRGSREQITAEVALVGGLLAPTGTRNDYVRWRLLPTRSELPPGRAGRSLAVARLEHVLRTVPRLPIGLLRRRPRMANGALGD